MKYKVAIFILLNLILQGCKPDSEYEVAGTVVDGKNGAPVSKAKVFVEFSKLENGAYSNAFTPIAETETDEGGNYRVEFEAEKVVEYRVRVSRDGFFALSDTIDRNEWRANEANTFPITLYRSTDINFRFFAGNSGVTVLFKLYPDSPGCTNCCSESNYVFSGKIDTSFSCPVYGNQIIDYELTRITGVQSSQEIGTIDLFEDQVSFEYQIN